MGGDLAPKQIVLGAVESIKQDKEICIILVGDEEKIKAELALCSKYDQSRIEIVHASEVIDMEEEDVARAVRKKRDSSVVVAFRLLKEGKADALVACGATGAVLSAGVLVLGRLKGVSRPALCPRIPNHRGTGTVICDCGANLECKPVNLAHFAIMATAYAQASFGVQNPKIGLLNNGTEDHKGLELQREAHKLLKDMDFLNYVGNVEGRDIMYSDIDVIVSDGFTGNIALKSIEGCGKAVSTILNGHYKRNLWTKLRAAMSLDIIKRIKGSLDYKAVGGAMFLGLTKPVVKGHGNTEARSVPVYVQQAANAVRGNMIENMKTMIDEANAKLAVLEAKQAEAASAATPASTEE